MTSAESDAGPTVATILVRRSMGHDVTGRSGLWRLIRGDGPGGRPWAFVETGRPRTISSLHVATGRINSVHVATLNLRNTADRWRERRGLLVAQLVDLAPDVIGVQELRMHPDQAGWIAGQVARGTGDRLRYRAHRRGKRGLLGLWEGIGVLSRSPVVATAWRDLGAQSRVAQRVTVRSPEGGLVDVYNAHLGLGGEAVRLAQARRLLAWMDAAPPGPAVLVGDLNARPGSPTIELLSTRLRSAHLDVHGCERPLTVPTALRGGPARAGSVLDYVFVNRQVVVDDARIAFDRTGPGDATLCASDHFGLSVTVRCSPASPGRRRR
jgi:endonuclease/exonuclease/phosphatase family metal-dependent hydrolase